MEITSSYQVEILSNADMKSTVQIYRRALAFVIDVCNKELQHIKYVDERLERHLCNLHNEDELDDTLVIKGLTLVEGNDGLFLSFPSKKGKDGNYYNISTCGAKNLSHFL